MSLSSDVKKVIKSLSKDFVVLRQTSSDSIDYTGTPSTNSNYGKNIITTSSLEISMSCQRISNNDSLNDSLIRYIEKGYRIEGALKIKSLEELKVKDIITFADGFEYEVVEANNKHLPPDYEFSYSRALALRKQYQ